MLSYIYRLINTKQSSVHLGLERKALIENPEINAWHDLYDSSIILLKVEEKKINQLEKIKLQIEEKN